MHELIEGIDNGALIIAILLFGYLAYQGLKAKRH